MKIDASTTDTRNFVKGIDDSSMSELPSMATSLNHEKCITTIASPCYQCPIGFVNKKRSPFRGTFVAAGEAA
jgi:hypothetical protein